MNGACELAAAVAGSAAARPAAETSVTSTVRALDPLTFSSSVDPQIAEGPITAEKRPRRTGMGGVRAQTSAKPAPDFGSHRAFLHSG